MSDSPLWARSYANWCTALGDASRKYRSRIAYGSETYDAFTSGVSPDAYALLHSPGVPKVDTPQPVKPVKKPRAPAKPRKAKAKAGPETDRQRLERIVEERAAAARYSFKHGLRENETDRGNLFGARRDLARRIANDLGHIPLTQGISYECSRCGKSGSFDVEPVGAIFTEPCGS